MFVGKALPSISSIIALLCLILYRRNLVNCTVPYRNILATMAKPPYSTERFIAVPFLCFA
jgi:hypothetical protein